MMSWLLETTKDSFDTIESDQVELRDGCLNFYNVMNGPTFPVLLLAPGQWVSVVPGE